MFILTKQPNKETDTPGFFANKSRLHIKKSHTNLTMHNPIYDNPATPESPRFRRPTTPDASKNVAMLQNISPLQA